MEGSELVEWFEMKRGVCLAVLGAADSAQMMYRYLSLFNPHILSRLPCADFYEQTNIIRLRMIVEFPVRAHFVGVDGRIILPPQLHCNNPGNATKTKSKEMTEC